MTNMKKHANSLHKHELLQKLDELKKVHKKNKNVQLKEKFLRQPKINSVLPVVSGGRGNKKLHPKLYDMMMLSAIDGVSYKIMEKERFQNIIQIGTNKKEFRRNYEAVNAKNLQKHQKVYVQNLRGQIMKELKGKTVHLKLDFGTYHSVPFLGKFLVEIIFLT